jgi:hypothetical protein
VNLLLGGSEELVRLYYYLFKRCRPGQISKKKGNGTPVEESCGIGVHLGLKKTERSAFINYKLISRVDNNNYLSKVDCKVLFARIYEVLQYTFPFDVVVVGHEVEPVLEAVEHLLDPEGSVPNVMLIKLRRKQTKGSIPVLLVDNLAIVTHDDALFVAVEPVCRRTRSF